MLRLMYIRATEKDFSPCGVFVISINKEEKKISYQYAVLNPNDRDRKTGKQMKFDRKEAQRLAAMRLISDPITVINVPQTWSQHDVYRSIMNDVLMNAKEFPSRLVKFARWWIFAAEQMHGKK